VDLIRDIIQLLSNQEQLSPENNDHNLIGNYKDFRVCHIKPDWLLIYKIDDDIL